MKINQKFNTITKSEYFFYIENHKRFTDFNSLGLYRSIVENEKLDTADKIQVRDYAHTIFGKTFEFLQLKDPVTYVKVSTIGQTLTKADEHQIWEDIKRNQQKILADKQIKHRNFGIYSIHDCGYETCPFNGIMIKQGSFIAESHVRFDGDKNKYAAKSKSLRLKKEKKNLKANKFEE